MSQSLDNKGDNEIELFINSKSYLEATQGQARHQGKTYTHIYVQFHLVSN